jgi:hypothetical protein
MELWSSIIRAWEIAPSSQRIVDDISKLPEILKTIIKHDGAVIPDEYFRTGRRYVSCKNENKEIKKPRNSQRKSTIEQNEIHPDCIEAYNNIKLGIKTYEPYVDLIYDVLDNIEDIDEI